MVDSVSLAAAGSRSGFAGETATFGAMTSSRLAGALRNRDALEKLSMQME
jgi:hypothetical protein